MKNDYEFNGFVTNGFLMLFLNVILTLACIGGIIATAVMMDDPGLPVVAFCLLLVVSFIIWGGFVMQEPNEASVMIFFGEYRGTFTKTGFYWVNPFVTAKKLSLRARNLDAEPIKVNDKVGNPVIIGLVLVWKLKDAYKAMFEIDAQTIAKSKNAMAGSTVGVMNALENFVKVQSDAALRQVAGSYAYDESDQNVDELTLRGGGEEINDQLEAKLNERLALAGIEVVEARINYLAYAPEIAATMLRRQQASAIITAREKIVEGAVSMVKMALDKLSDEQIVQLDEKSKAAMVGNLLVVLCADESAQPVVNTSL